MKRNVVKKWEICRLHFLLASLTLCPIGLAVSPETEQSLEITSKQTVSGPTITLKDIVKDPSSLPSGWGSRTVMPSPELGKSINYSLIEVATALEKYPDMHNILLRGDLSLRVERAGTSLSFRDISRAVDTFVHEHDNWSGANISVECEPLKSKIKLPAGPISINVESFVPQRESNRYLFDAVIRSNGKKVQAVSVYARVIPMQEVWVASHMLSRGAVLTQSDLSPKLLPVHSSTAFVPTGESITDLELKQAVRGDQPLNWQNLLQQQCARRGDWISVSVSSGALSISLRAKALAAGRKGEHIFCMNERSKRRLGVKLVGPKQAIMEL